jgi:hypothetical protein
MQIAAARVQKFVDPARTVTGEARATVAFRGLETLWVNTGTLCNLTCNNCYIESSPRNDRLAFITAAELRAYLDEMARDALPTRVIGFTGGEPFMNPEFLDMLEDVLARGFDALVLTNAMRPMRKAGDGLLALRAKYGARLRVRVSLDHYAPAVHEDERGVGTWAPGIAGFCWLAENLFAPEIASRRLSGESEAEIRAGFAQLMARLGVALDVTDPVTLVVFPEMDVARDVPEITASCWGILKKTPDSVMCSSSRMVVKRRDAVAPVVVACTLLPYDERFEMGRTLAEASRTVSLNHKFCAAFCVLGGGACSQ